MPVLWLILALPALALIAAYALDAQTYGQSLSNSGLLSAALLALTLSASPLRRHVPALLRYRRTLGVAMFAYAALHTAIYLQRKYAVAAADALSFDLGTGWIALALATPLAITSTHDWVKRLGRRWTTLHRLVYVIAVLTALHWLLTAYDPTTALIFSALILILLGVRAYRRYR